MEQLPHFLTLALNLAGVFKYPLVFLGCIIEGPLVMIAAGFLLRLGHFEFWPLFGTIIIGDLIADIFWYYLGYFFLDRILHRHGHWFSITPELVTKTKTYFARYHDTLLIISKATLGFGLILGVLMVAGASRVPLRRFLAMNFLGELVLVVILLSLGYFFGEMYNQISEGFRLAFVIITALISIALVYGFANYMKHKVQQTI
jgi:membrane protein DedA with SNARE-associated domain